MHKSKFGEPGALQDLMIYPEHIADFLGKLSQLQRPGTASSSIIQKEPVLFILRKVQNEQHRLRINSVGGKD